MNKEEAMKILQHYLEMEEFNNAGDFLIAIDIVLNLIQKQSKIIDKMAEHLADIIINDDNASLLPFYDYQENLKEEVKEYFKKEVVRK